MGQVTRRRTASTLHHWTKPVLIVREQPDAKSRSDTNTGLAGQVRSDLIPLGYSIEPGPIGGTLQLRDPNMHWLKSGQTVDELEDFRASTFTLEIRKRSGDRTLQDIQFRGVLDGEALSYQEENNGVTLNVRDWFAFADAPIKMPTYDYSGPLSAGRILYLISQGYYVQSGYEFSAPFTRAVGFPQFPFPLDRSGNPVAGIDPDLIEIETIPYNIALTGQPLAQAFADVLYKVNPNWIPALRYESNGFITLTRNIRGDRKRELVIHAVGSDYAAPSVKANCQSITGAKDYSRVYNTGQALGSNDRVVNVFRLTKEWTEAEETLFVATNGIPTPQTQHVGKAYAMPTRVFWTAGIPATFSSLEKSDRIKARRRRTDAGGDWEYFDMKVIPPRQTKGSIRKGNIIDRMKPHPSEYNMVQLEMESPMFYYYYTEAQEAIRAAGGSVGQPSIGFYDIEVEATEIGRRLEVRYGALDDYPRMRTLAVENNNAARYVFTQRIDVDRETGSATTSTDEDGDLGFGASFRDDSAFLLDQLTNIIEDTKRPGSHFSAVLWHYDPDWKLGDHVFRIRDVTGNVLADNLEWYVESIDHDLQNWTTTIRLSTVINDLKARMLIR